VFSELQQNHFCVLKMQQNATQGTQIFNIFQGQYPISPLQEGVTHCGSLTHIAAFILNFFLPAMSWVNKSRDSLHLLVIFHSINAKWRCLSLGKATSLACHTVRNKHHNLRKWGQLVDYRIWLFLCTRQKTTFVRNILQTSSIWQTPSIHWETRSSPCQDLTWLHMASIPSDTLAQSYGVYYPKI